MARPKAQTLQQRFGFQDKDLSTPKHDEIMLWLDENIVTILNDMSWIKEYFDSEVKDTIPSIIRDGILSEQKKKELISTMPSYQQKFEVKIIDKTWEKPIRTDRDFVIGFIDLYLEIKIPILGWMEGWGWETGELHLKIYFEVKTEIKSLGELFRQVQMYKDMTQIKYDSKYFTKIVIVSPDDRFKKKIIEQGFGFVHYVPWLYSI